MCPPAQSPPPSEIDSYWTDEQIISLLDEYTPGSRLPDNVLADSSPYQYPPSNLPEGIWYLVHPNEKKESVYGFWKTKGEACKICSNSMISGWRTTLEYFEGKAPHGRRTDWLMHEYMIAHKELCNKDKPKESRLLCRVFLSSENEMHPQGCKIGIESKKINSEKSNNPDANITSGQDCRCESKEKRECEVESPPEVVDDKQNSSPQVFSELECFLRGDYLELDDLEDPESHSSSSQNSSCPSKLSDEYFDSSAFLRDLEEEERNYMQGQQSSSRYSLTTSLRPNDVVLQPPSSGSLSSCLLKADRVEDSRTGSSSRIQESSTDKRADDHTTKRQNPDNKFEGTSNSSSMGTPSTIHKKAGAGRMKKLRTYFCFATF